MKLSKLSFIFLFMLIQTAIATFGGLLALYINTKDTIPQETYIGTVNVGGLTDGEAITKLKDEYEKLIINKSLAITYDNNKEFIIKYNDIGTVIDYQETLDNVYSSKGIMALNNLVKGYSKAEKKVGQLIVKVNEDLLRQKMAEFAKLIDKEPVSAWIDLKDGKIIKKPDIAGVKVNIENAAVKVKNCLNQNLGAPISFSVSNNYEIAGIAPKYPSSYFDGVEDVIGSYTTEIKSQEVKASVKNAALAINKVLLFPKDEAKSLEAGEFSFNKYLAKTNSSWIMEENNEGYNQVASTTYAAALVAGINFDAVSRTQSDTTKDYISAGLDTRVLGNSIDFKFKNTLDNTIIVFASLKDNKLTVSIAGKRQSGNEKREIDIKIKEKLSPSIEDIESKELNTGESKIVSLGKEGLTVDVYLVNSQAGGKADIKLLYSNKYNPVNTIRHVGPNTVVEDSAKESEKKQITQGTELPALPEERK